MAEAADAIASHAARGRAVFDTDPAVQDAILYRIMVLGEAAKVALAAAPSLSTSCPEIDWRPIVRMRDLLAHHYWATDLAVVWTTATESVPELRRAVAAALATVP